MDDPANGIKPGDLIMLSNSAGGDGWAIGEVTGIVPGGGTITFGMAVQNNPSIPLAGPFFGTITPAAVATPEPSSLALMLSGVGLVFAVRKRFSGLQLAS